MINSGQIDVVVVGGSLTGLAAGVALKTVPNVKSITILERYQESRLQDQGAGIRVGPEVQEFYQKYAGVTPDDYALTLNRCQILAKDGSVVREAKVQLLTTGWSQLFRVLKETFVESSTSCVCRYRNGCRVESLVEKGSKVDVLFQNEAGYQETVWADLVLGADGASSIVRQLFLPEIKRTYAGYVIFRGLVPLEGLSDQTKATLDWAGIMCWNHNSQAISYSIPDCAARAKEGETICNWGWYTIEQEEELADLLMDANGLKHEFSIPIGAMQEKWITRIKTRARQELPPQLAEAIEKTENPFAQVITDSLASENVYCAGRVLLLGDAAAGQRPHTGSAVSQCVLAATLLVQYLQSQIEMAEWSRETHSISQLLVNAGKELGSICMSTSLSPQEKMTQYVPKLMGTHKQLLAKWEDNKAKVPLEM